MKKFTIIIIALMSLTFALIFSQCKKHPIDNNLDSEKKVRVSCSIPINKGSRSDFSNILENGMVNWSDGRECVYVAIHGDNPQIIELEAWADGNPSRLEFTGSAAENLIENGAEYEIWYFGHSQQLGEDSYIELSNGVISGSIANQSGSVEDLGFWHIAKTKVTAQTVNGDVVLDLNGTLQNQIAIALLDLADVEELYGNAIVGTEYTLAYNSTLDKFELNVLENNNAKISVESAIGISYVVLLPNETGECMIKCKKNSNTYAYTFHNGIKSNKLYYRTASDGVTKQALSWSEYEEEIPEPENNALEYVDLGLPSGLKWANCNLGATTPEGFGSYYAWGETAPKLVYREDNSLTAYVENSELQAQGIIDENNNLTMSYDAARVNLGGGWRMPTSADFKELKDNCTMEAITLNGVEVMMYTAPNGNSIFMPKAGCSDISEGSYCYYWTSTADEHFLYANHDYYGTLRRWLGASVRPVIDGDYEGTMEVYAYVDTEDVGAITDNGAVCGGNVTSDNGSAVIAKGVCWSTSQNPTIANSKTIDGTGTGSFTSTLTNLEPNTTYYVRAYVTNGAGTSYGRQVNFTTTTGTINGYGYVDLGLPSGVKWATCNVGASVPKEYGDYFASGETEPKEYYDPNYSFNMSESNYLGNPQHDAATANWGGTWRMPTKDELNELVNYCTWERIIIDGVYVNKVTSKTNNNSIILPAAGYKFQSYFVENQDGSKIGRYWSVTDDTWGTNSTDDVFYYCLDISSRYSQSVGSRGPSFGFSVRPVSD